MSTSKVFIPHEEFVWVTGQIVVDTDSKGDVQVKIQDELLPNEIATRTINLPRIGIPSLPQQNLEVPPQGVDDMTKLNYLHEPSILDNLKRCVLTLS
jgi:myosin heavy subunit